VAVGLATSLPARREAAKAGADDAWTPTTRTPGRRARSAAAIPVIRPPPPTPTSTVSTSGTWSSSSSPTVPCPATTVRSSKGWTSRRAPSSAYAAAARRAASIPPGTCSTRAPQRRVRATFTAFAPSGTKIVASEPNRAAANATPWAWLPALAATTPRARAAGSAAASRT
jgi:hypothetical protein